MFAHAYFAGTYFAPRYYPPAGSAPAPVEVELGAARRVLARKEKRRRDTEDDVVAAAAADAGLVGTETETLAAAFERLAPSAQGRVNAQIARREGELQDILDAEARDETLRHHLKLLLDDEMILLAIRL